MRPWKTSLPGGAVFLSPRKEIRLYSRHLGAGGRWLRTIRHSGPASPARSPSTAGPKEDPSSPVHEEGASLRQHPGRGGADLDMVEPKTDQDPSGQAGLPDPAGSEKHRRRGGTEPGH